MAMGEWNWLRAVATLNLEGLTLKRGELSTGAYGEGFVDRRHPHTYAHELMAGAIAQYFGVQGSVFAGRGFVPFGSDDPMARPFEKYPVNHHLSQVLERLVAVAAVRRGPAILEVGTFNGDEPVSPSAAPQWHRFGDSFAARVTVLPIGGLELSASGASVKSPEVAAGSGLDQRKASVVSRFSRFTQTDWRYALVEWARTDERTEGRVTTRLSTWLGEAAVCHDGFIGAARLEQTDRPEEEQLQDPFRTPRPPIDLDESRRVAVDDAHAFAFTAGVRALVAERASLRRGGAHRGRAGQPTRSVQRGSALRHRSNVDVLRGHSSARGNARTAAWDATARPR